MSTHRTPSRRAAVASRPVSSKPAFHRSVLAVVLMFCVESGACEADQRQPVDAASDATDAGTSDAGASDAGAPDAGTPDAGAPDAGTPDAGAPDAGTPDAGARDAGAPDAGTPDAGTPDAGESDAAIDVDLVVTSVTSDATTIVSDELFSVTAVVRNDGIVASGSAVLLRVYLSANTSHDPEDVACGETTFATVPPGGTSSKTFTAAVPGGTPGGTYYVVAVVDPDDTEPETNDGNNTRAGPTVTYIP